MTGVTAYPLQWPAGRDRCDSQRNSQFKTTIDRSRREVVEEISRLGGTMAVISTNLRLRKDGFPAASAGRPADEGVAVYFMLADRQMVFACDQYFNLCDNMHAIALTIQALRGIKRWGSSEMMHQAFTGFQALPPGQSQEDKKEWWAVLEFDAPIKDPIAIRNKRNHLMRQYHPDIGRQADAVTAAKVNEAYEEAMDWIKSCVR